MGAQNQSTIEQMMLAIGQQARSASRAMAKASSEQKNRALLNIATAVRRDAAKILAANAVDIKRAKTNGNDAAFIDRLTMTEKSIENMALGLVQIASLGDPVGHIGAFKKQASGILIAQMRVPLGVIGIIYESRPNVTIDAAALCLKSGNAVILRGGSEAIDSNTYLAGLIQEGLAAAQLPAEAVQVVQTTDRAAVGKMITMTEYIDVIVPRGGKSLIARLMADGRVPMIKHLDGICHTYIDEGADLDLAIRVCDNAKRNVMRHVMRWKPYWSTPRSLRMCCHLFARSIKIRVLSCGLIIKPARFWRIVVLFIWLTQAKRIGTRSIWHPSYRLRWLRI